MKRVWSYAQRSHRNGRGLLPPNPRLWNVEHAALDVRETLQLPTEAALEHEVAYSLLPSLHAYALSDLPPTLEHLTHLRGPGASKWSGIAVRVDNEVDIVVYNDTHPMNRVRATLMEEFFHVWLDHPRSSLKVFSDAGRTYNPQIEVEAYGCGAASLLPYAGLKAKIAEGWSVREVARHFRVSAELVSFRAKVTRTYKALLSNERRQA